MFNCQIIPVRLLIFTLTFKITAVLSKKINLDVTSFEAVARSSSFIDKTLLIKHLLEPLNEEAKKKMWLINAPAGFGKTTNIDMLKTFLEITVDKNGKILDRVSSRNLKVFEERQLNIFKDRPFFDKHFAQYPVVRIDLNGLTANSSEDLKKSFSHLMHLAVEQHRYLPASLFVPEGAHETPTGSKLLQFLVDDLYEHFKKKCIVLVDVNETPMMRAMFSLAQERDLLHMHSFMKDTFYRDLLENDKISQVIVSRRVTGEGTYDPFHPNNASKHLSVFEDQELAKYYGFTQEEVDSLAPRYYKREKLGAIKFWYGGYRIKNSRDQIYSMYSVLKYLGSGVFRSHLSKSAQLFNFGILFNHESLGGVVEEMFTNDVAVVFRESIEFRQTNSLIEGLKVSWKKERNLLAEQVALQYLTESGYFTANYDHDDNKRLRERWKIVHKGDKAAAIKTPNFEMKLELSRTLYSFLYHQQKYDIRKERLKAFFRAVYDLREARSSYTKFARNVISFFRSHRPKSKGEFLGPLFSLCAFSGEVRAGLSPFYTLYGNLDLFIKRKDDSAIVVQVAFGQATAHSALTKILRTGPYIFEDYKPIRHTILIGFYYYNQEWAICYLYNSFNITEATFVGNKEKTA